MFPALRPLLNRGGAGRYISRAESAERLVPIAKRHLDLLYAYTGTLPQIENVGARESLDAFMPSLRTEVAKIYETILSLGGSAPTGVSRDPAGEAVAGATDSERLRALQDAERDFARALVEESEAVHHQERTYAILRHNAGVDNPGRGSDGRQALLREIASSLRRS